jgi:hypothetical protein
MTEKYLLEFSCYNNSYGLIVNTLSIISLIHVCVLPPFFNDGMRCLAYDFQGEFENHNLNQKNEKKKNPKIKKYY